MVRWSDGQVMRWSYVVRWSCFQVFRWSGGQMYLAMSGLGDAVEDLRAATCRFGKELFLPVGPARCTHQMIDHKRTADDHIQRIGIF